MRQNTVCRRFFETGCRGCHLAPYCNQQGFLPGKLVLEDERDSDLAFILSFAKENGLEIREIPEATPRTFVLT